MAKRKPKPPVTFDRIGKSYVGYAVAVRLGGGGEAIILAPTLDEADRLAGLMANCAINRDMIQCAVLVGKATFDGMHAATKNCNQGIEMTTTDTTNRDQLHADLRLAWKLLSDAGHDQAADRIFALLIAPPAQASKDAEAGELPPLIEIMKIIHGAGVMAADSSHINVAEAAYRAALARQSAPSSERISADQWKAQCEALQQVIAARDSADERRERLGIAPSSAVPEGWTHPVNWHACSELNKAIVEIEEYVKRWKEQEAGHAVIGWFNKEYMAGVKLTPENLLLIVEAAKLAAAPTTATSSKENK